MPRNASGVYTLPIASYVAATTIKSADMNSNLSDIATALTQSLATTGVTPMTGPILAASGSVAAPSISFASATGTGFYLSAANTIAIVTNGTLAATISSTQTTTWVGAATFQASVSVGTTLGVTGAGTFSSTIHVVGAATFDAALSIGTTLSVIGKASFLSTDSMALPNGTTGQRNGAPSAGDARYNSTLTCFEVYNGTSWIPAQHATTIQKFTSGAGNYVPAAGVQRIRVRMSGGGGGGGGATANTGSVGVDSSFGLWTAIHGNGGVFAGAGGTGGTGGVDGTGTLTVRIPGGKGFSSVSGLATSGCILTVSGGMGAANPFGGGGSVTGGAAGSNGATNTGAGGGGGGNSYSGGGSGGGGGGGGAGEYVEFWVDAPANPTAYVVGGGGNGGAAGAFAGGNGAAGIIIIEEFYI